MFFALTFCLCIVYKFYVVLDANKLSLFCRIGSDNMKNLFSIAHHAISDKELLADFKSQKEGLSSNEANERLQSFGPNKIPMQQKVSVFMLLVKQFKSLLIWVLLIAALISWFADHEIDAVVIALIVVLNAIIGFSQEYKAEKAVSSLQKMIVPIAKVMRDGNLQQINSENLVPGDIIVLEEGDSIPADARILEESNLRCIESALTGESVPVGKSADVLDESVSMADRSNMLWKGTFVAGGNAVAMVCGTGKNTKIGNIATTLGNMQSSETHFQQKTRILARQMAIFSIVMASALFATAYFIRNYELIDVFMVAIASLVSAIPEGLPAILSVVLAIGANRMAKRNAIIREFTATETLGAVTTIITDKTGTLTQSVLLVKKLFVPGEPELDVSGEGYTPEGEFVSESKSEISIDFKAFQIAAFSNNSNIVYNEEDKRWNVVGDPTEGALLVMAKKAKVEQHLKAKMLFDFPFSSELKMRATLVHTEKYGNELLVVGAPEKVLQASSKIYVNGTEQALDASQLQMCEEKIQAWSNNAMRVLALAYKPMNTARKVKEEEFDNLVFAGFVGMIDPPRPDVKEAISSCHQAGIRVIMATGDHVKTAAAIAKEIGIINENQTQTVEALNENDLLEMTDEALIEAIRKVNVFARLSPNMKLRIAEILQNEGEIVAMTGDGVNDAPALKKANVGIAMGIMGTDVARNAAQVVLADDNFSTIVSAIEEGRIVFTNARMASFFLITTNFAEVLTLITSVAIGLPMPLTATQILWLNLVTDGVNGLALASEPGHGDVLKQKPVNPKEQILNKDVLPFMIINAIVMMSLTIGAFNYFLQFGETHARTAAFIVMAFTQIFNMFNMRSLKRSVFDIGFFSNKYTNIALVLSIILQILVVEIPFLSEVFYLSRLEFVDLLIIVSLSSLVFVFGELYKRIKYSSH